MSARHILLVDDDLDVQQGVGFMLSMAGYAVHRAANRVEAWRCLGAENIHAAVLDIRLEANDTADDSGLRLAAELPAHLPRIIYTGYADPVFLRRALEERGGIRPAHQFVDKGAPDASDQLLAALADVFANAVEVNFDLVIEDATLLSEFGRRLALPDEGIPDAEIARDIEEILRRLFYARAPEPSVQSIALTPLLPYHLPSATSRSSAIVLRAQPRFAEGDVGHAQVVKLGARAETEAEAEHHRPFVKRLGAAHYAQLESQAAARWVGGLRYTFIGAANLEQVTLFSAYYHAHTAVEAVQCLSRFFRETYCHIMQGKECMAQRDLRHDYVDGLHLTPAKLRRALLDYFSEAELAQPMLTFSDLQSQPILNPYAWAVDSTGAFRSMPTESVFVAWGHGDLHSHNLLVDEDGNGWLIDCARASRGHALRDFVELETDIKFSLLPTTDLSLLWLFESALLTPAQLGQPAPELPLDDADIQKAYAVILGVRAIAHALIGAPLNMREYYAALFYQTLNVARLKPDTRWGAALAAEGKTANRTHALLSAALLAERLEHWPEWPPPTPAAAAVHLTPPTPQRRGAPSFIERLVRFFFGPRR